MKTERTVPISKADIIIRNNEKETYLLIDIAISEDINMVKEGTKMVLNYEDLIRPYNGNVEHV